MNPRYLKNPSHVPGNGWLARQPETGTVIKGLSFVGLQREVEKYRLANKLPVDGNIRRQVEIQICDTMPEDEACTKCRFLDEEDTKNPKHLRAWTKTKDDLWNFAIAVKGVIGAALTGKQLHVTQAEADRRAAICAQCKFNLPIGNCRGCGALGSLHRELSGSLSTSKDSLLDNCGVCGCELPLKIWFTQEVLGPIMEKQGQTPEIYPEWCWTRALFAGQKEGDEQPAQ
jgi:hypothetical protein